MYHSECYEKATGRKCARCTTQFDGYCEYCRAFIPAGTTGINWRRRWAGQSNGKPLPEQPTITDAPATPPADATVLPAQDMTEVMGLLKALENRLTTMSTYFGMLTSRVENLESTKPMVAEVVVKSPAKPDGVNVGKQHKQFQELLELVSAGISVFLVGPAGSGKTTAAMNVAKALGREFYYTGAVADQYGLTGYNDANGKFVETPWFRAYRDGGVFLWDELDSSSASATMAFTAALENGKAAFPCGMVDRHPDLVVIAAGNTWGNGATSEYVGRNRLDAAFIDRFARVDWSYDEALETELAPNKAWCKYVQQVRASAAKAGAKILISPRATIRGGKMLNNGMKPGRVIDICLKAGIPATTWDTIKGTVPNAF